MSALFDPRPEGLQADGFVFAGVLIEAEKTAAEFSAAESLQQLDDCRRRYEQAAFDNHGSNLGNLCAWMARFAEDEIASRNVEAQP